MATFNWPGFGIASVSWTFDQPAQVNRSSYTGVRAVASNPWHGKWSAKVQLATKQGDGAFQVIRGFFTGLNGSINNFHLPAVEAPQNANTGVTVAAYAAQGAQSLSLTGLTTALVAGNMVTIGGQLLSIISVSALSGSAQTINFMPTLRAAALAILTAPTLNAPSTATTGGTLAAATYYYKVVAFNATGQTLGSNEVSQVTTGTTSTVSLSWNAIAGATSYRVYRGTAAGAESVYYAPGNVTSFTDTGAANTAGTVPGANTTTAASVETAKPYALVALTDSSFSWDIAQWRQYGLSFTVDEDVGGTDGASPSGDTWNATWTTTGPSPGPNVLGVAVASNGGAASQVTTINFSKNLSASVAGSTATIDLQYSINVLDKGAVGDGVTDDTAAFNAAHTAAASGAKVYVPSTAGQYLIAGTIIAKAPMFGDGEATVLKTSSATADVVQIGVPNITISDLQITSTVTRTAGYYVNFNGASANSNYNSRVERCTFGNWYNCIGFTGAGTLNTIRVVDCWLTTSTPLGVGITFNNGAAVIDAVLRDVFITGGGAGAQPNIGVSLDYVGDILLDHVSTVYCSLGLNVAPTGSHTAESVFINNCLFDSGGNSGIRVGGSTGTTVNLVQIHNTWSCTNTKGLLINGSGGAIQRVEVIGCYFCNNTSGHGIQADVVQYLDVNGGTFAGNTNGINIAAGVSNFKIRGARCGTSGLFPVNSNYGILIAAGSSTGFVIEGNDLTGNTGGALSNGATGSTGIVENNLGVNPGATGTITVTASPFTYTAGYSPETVYVGGGTVTGLSVGGQGLGVSTGAVRLGPKQAVVVTYTAAPTMIKSVA